MLRQRQKGRTLGEVGRASESEEGCVWVVFIMKQNMVGARKPADVPRKRNRRFLEKKERVKETENDKRGYVA